MAKTIRYCDECGDVVWMSHPDPMNPRQESTVKEHKNYERLPFDVASANKGESGTLCYECVIELNFEHESEHF